MKLKPPRAGFTIAQKRLLKQIRGQRVESAENTLLVARLAHVNSPNLQQSTSLFFCFATPSTQGGQRRLTSLLTSPKVGFVLPFAPLLSPFALLDPLSIPFTFATPSFNTSCNRRAALQCCSSLSHTSRTCSNAHLPLK